MWERANEQSIRLVLNNVTREWLSTANKGHSRKNDRLRSWLQKGFLDVQTILEEDQGRVSVLFWQSGGDQVEGGGPNVWYAFCTDNNIIVRWEALGGDVWDGIANCGGLEAAIALVATTESELGISTPTLGLNPFNDP